MMNDQTEILKQLKVIAHDFNNMLSVVFGNANLATVKAEKGEPIERYILIIQEAARSAASDVQSMQTLIQHMITNLEKAGKDNAER